MLEGGIWRRDARGAADHHVAEVPQTDENGEYRPPAPSLSCRERRSAVFLHLTPLQSSLLYSTCHAMNFDALAHILSVVLPGHPCRYMANAYMDKTDVLSKPVNEIIEVKKGKSKKKHWAKNKERAPFHSICEALTSVSEGRPGAGPAAAVWGPVMT